MKPQAATGAEIAHHFNSIDPSSGNWGTCSCHGAHCKWNVPGTTTYINGIMLTIDRDYEMGYLLEVCDSAHDGEAVVTHLAVEVRHTDVANWAWAAHRPYKFFARTVEISDVYSWFVGWYSCAQEVRDT